MPKKGILRRFLYDALKRKEYPNLFWVDREHMTFALNIINKRNKYCPTEFERIYKDWHNMKVRSSEVADKAERFKAALRSAKFLKKYKVSMNNKMLFFQFKDKAIAKAVDKGGPSTVDYEAFPVSSPESGYVSCSSPEYQGHDCDSPLLIHNYAKSPESDSGYNSLPDSPGLESSVMEQQSVAYDVADSHQETQPAEGDGALDFDFVYGDLMMMDDDVLDAVNSSKFCSDYLENNISSSFHNGFEGIEGKAGFGSFDISLPPNVSMPKLENGFMSPGLDSNSGMLSGGSGLCVCSEPVQRVSTVGDESSLFDLSSFQCDRCKKQAEDLMSGISSEPLLLRDGTSLGVVQMDGKTFFVAMKQIHPVLNTGHVSLCTQPM